MTKFRTSRERDDFLIEQFKNSIKNDLKEMINLVGREAAIEWLKGAVTLLI